MFINLNFIFTLINFGTLIGLGVYLYYKYGKPLLSEYMRSQVDLMRLLQLEEMALIEEQNRLTALINEEQRMAAYLQEQVTRWRNVQAQESIEEYAHLQAIQKSLEKKAHVQAEWYAHHRLAGRILPQVIDKARHRLKEQLHDHEKQAAYTQAILTHMKKSQL